MIEHKHGAYLHRQNPELIARAVAIKRENLGDFYVKPIKIRREPGK